MKIPGCMLSVVLTLFFFQTSVSAQEKFDFGKHWAESGIKEKMSYVDGYQAGYLMGVMNATKFFMPTETEQQKEEAFKRASMIFGDRRFGTDMLASIIVLIDKLYENPDNKYIDKSFILEAAIDKLRGRDIEEVLRLHRKSAEEQ